MFPLDDVFNSLYLFVHQTQDNLIYLETILIILFGVFFLSKFVPAILFLGIQPRKLSGLPGIVFAPFLHANFNHLFFNSIPLVVLSDFVLINGLPIYLFVTIVITLLSGFLIWCFAKPGIHLGASALVTGYWGYLVCNIYRQGTFLAIFLGVICCYYFAGILFGIFPREKGVSWEGHLFGLLSGIAVSYLLYS